MLGREKQSPEKDTGLHEFGQASIEEIFLMPLCFACQSIASSENKIVQLDFSLFSAFFLLKYPRHGSYIPGGITTVVKTILVKARNR